MYQDFFGLHEKPFSIAPDPRYLYMTEQHREALAHLLFGVGDEGGFILLTGEVGTGKTTICRSLLNRLPDNTDVAFIVNPRLSVDELLQSICDDLSIVYPGNASIKDLVDALNQFLLNAYASGRNTILIIDEAQNLADEVLEQLRLLTNLETNEKKLLQLILLGQPELNEKLAQTSLRQLAQRVTARFHLKPLSELETIAYIQHRLYVAGYRGELFSKSALKCIHSESAGVPRLVNVICDRAMLGAYAESQSLIEFPIVLEACKEVLGASFQSKSTSRLPAIFSLERLSALLPLLLIAILISVVILIFQQGAWQEVLQILSRTNADVVASTFFMPIIFLG
ncbi:MAG: AAA family ATPase [Pseudomonadota bacterium]|nr:AAA family ATPase [Pseudomonadota bacterium]